MDTKMDVTNDIHMKMEVENGLCKEKQHLSLDEGSSSSCRREKARCKPKLQSTKSFPPYSQCIGGLGQDEDEEEDCDNQLTSSDVVMREDGNKATERMEDFEMNTSYARDEVRVKWRSRRRERSGGSYEGDTDRRERIRWSMRRRVEESGRERRYEDEERKGGQRQHSGGRNLSFKVKSTEEEEMDRSSVSYVQGEEGESVESTEQEEEELPGMREGSTSHLWSSPHPILSRLMHSSSSSSSCCSSVNLSSAESDEVFSEGEDAGSKRRTFRKCRSWKTYLTMMHWSMRRQSSWVQLAGHQGNFQLSEGGEVLKLYSEVEERCLGRLMMDQLRPFVPQYHGLVTREEHCYIRLDDLLSGLRRPVIMDCKMGVRTFQEEEILRARTKASLRSDMYHKMVKLDPSAPSAEEHAQKAVTKLRYLQWRDATSSTATLGFRIEGIMMEDGNVQRDFRKILTLAQATEALLYFTRSHLEILKAYHSRLLSLNDTLKKSQFFKTHEVVGSSLLFVHDSSKANVWMIDFGKTTPVPDSKEVLHDVPWSEGSREDGYLIGLTSLIASLGQAISMASWQQQTGSGEEKNVT